MFGIKLYRNVRAGELLEWFFVSAVATVLLVRFFLNLSHYPQIGGHGLHIAHMLWGGLLMAAGLVISGSFLGVRAHRLSSILGGIGFGLFIDELGKFITQDNNYFFKPTVALIYIVFMLLFILFRTLGRERHLTQHEYLLNAIMMMEEAVIRDLDKSEKNRVLKYLAKADASNPLVTQLKQVMSNIDPQVEEGGFSLRGAARYLGRIYKRLIGFRLSPLVIDWFFALKAVVSLVGIASVIIALFLSGSGTDQTTPAWFQFASSAVSTVFIVRGVLSMPKSRVRAYEWFVKATLVDIFITQFFSFYREQFHALPVFIFHIAVYLALRFAIEQERRLALRATA